MRGRLAVCVLVLAGCAGPHAQVSIGGKALPVDVAFGAPDAAIVPASTRTVLVPVPGGVGLLPVPVTRLPVSTATKVGQGGPPPPVALPTCPEPGPGAFPKDAATPVATGLPALGSYLVRYTARVVQDGVSRTFAGNARHTVTTTSSLPAGATTFDVDVTMLGADSTFSWATVPASYNAAGATPGGQIALKSVSGSAGLGYAASFHPATPLEVMAQPAFAGETFSGASTDADSGAVGQIAGTVEGHGQVNACGTPLDAWTVKSTLTTSSSNQSLVTTLVTSYATEYGGLPIAQTETYSGTTAGHQVSGTLSWSYSQPPRSAS